MGLAVGSVPGAYAERADASPGVLDRWASRLAWNFHRVFRRRLPDPGPFSLAIADRAARLPASGALSTRLPDLRYRLRRDGFRDELIAECFGLYGAALARCGRPELRAEAMGAARALTGGALVDHGDASSRLDALALAAAAFALQGTPVHLLSLTEPRARRIADYLVEPFEALGLRVGCLKAGMAPGALAETFGLPVVCGAHREIAAAYLQDRLSIAGKPRLILRAIESGGSREGSRRAHLLSGLHCALVDDADLVMLDDIYAPVTVTADADFGPQKLLYEQALELARACEHGRDFTLDNGARLTSTGAAQLERLVAPLGGLWAGRQRREELVTTALDALHVRQAGTDYRVEQGRVVFPRPPLGAEQDAQPDPGLRLLIELKEGCRVTAARDVLARISVPRFYRRYLHLAGVCSDARGAESEFWELYGLKAMRTGTPPPRVECPARVFVTAAARRAALLESVGLHAKEAAVLVAVRTSAEVQGVMQALADAGHRPGFLRGTLDDTERAALAALDHPGKVAVTMFPGYRLVSREVPAGARLHLILAELHDSRRHTALVQRAFAAGSCEWLLSLDEEGITPRIATLATGIARFRNSDASELPLEAARWIARLAQRDAEHARVLMRREVVLRDQHMRDLLAFSGRRE